MRLLHLRCLVTASPSAAVDLPSSCCLSQFKGHQPDSNGPAGLTSALLTKSSSQHLSIAEQWIVSAAADNTSCCCPPSSCKQHWVTAAAGNVLGLETEEVSLMAVCLSKL